MENEDDNDISYFDSIDNNCIRIIFEGVVKRNKNNQIQDKNRLSTLIPINSTIWDIKIHYFDCIEELEGFDPLSISLFLISGEKELEDDKYLCDYNIINDTCIIIAQSPGAQRKSTLLSNTTFGFHKIKLNYNMTFVVGRGISHGLLGHTSTFTIYSITKMKKYPPSLGDEKFQIYFTLNNNNDIIEFKTDIKQNKYKTEVSYQPDQVGKFLIHILFKKQHIGKSPYPVTVLSEKSIDIRELIKNGWDYEASVKANKLSKNFAESNHLFQVGMDILKYLHSCSSDSIQKNMIEMLDHLLTIDRNKIRIMMKGGIEYISCVLNSGNLWTKYLRICIFSANCISKTLQMNNEFINKFFKFFNIQILKYLCDHNNIEINRYISLILSYITRDNNNIEILLENNNFFNIIIPLIKDNEIICQRHCLDALKNISCSILFHKNINIEYLTIIMELLRSSDRTIQYDSLIILSNIKNPVITDSYVNSNIFSCVFNCFTTEGTLSWWEIGLFNCNAEQYIETHFKQSEHRIQSDLNIASFKYLNMIFLQASYSEKQGIAIHICNYKSNSLLKNFCKLAGAIDPSIQKEACQTLEYIAAIPEARDKIIDSGGIAWIMATVRHVEHEAHPFILSALAKISLSFTPRTTILDDESSFFPTLLKLIHSEQQIVQRNAAIILGHLMKNSNYKKRIISSGDCVFLFDLLLQAAKDRELSIHNTSIKWTDINLEERLAEGASLTTVQKCTLHTNGKSYAIKLFNSNDRSILSEIHTEVCLMSILNHKRIVQAVSASLTKPHLFILSKLYVYGSISELMKITDLDFSIIIRMLIDVAQGMEYLHSLNIVHRDLKPGNLLVNEKFRISITDFGTTRVQKKRMTPVPGTAMYMAPDMIESDSYTTKVDIYSFAIVMWEMIEKKLPYPDNMSAVDIIVYVKEGNRPEIQTKSPLEDLIRNCWDHNPDNRPTFTEILETLEYIALDYQDNIKFPVVNHINFNVQYQSFDDNTTIVSPPVVSPIVNKQTKNINPSQFMIVDSPSGGELSDSPILNISRKKKETSKRFKDGIAKMLTSHKKTLEQSDISEFENHNSKNNTTANNTTANNNSFENPESEALDPIQDNTSEDIDFDILEIQKKEESQIKIKEIPEYSHGKKIKRKIDETSSISSDIGFEHSFSQDPIESDIPLSECDDRIKLDITPYPVQFGIKNEIYTSSDEYSSDSVVSKAKRRKIYSKTMIEQQQLSTDLSTSQDTPRFPLPENTKKPRVFERKFSRLWK